MAAQGSRSERRLRRRARGIAVNGVLLRQARLDAGLTLGDVAGGEMSRQAVHQFEAGVARPTLGKLRVILDRLGLSLDSIRSEWPDEHESRMAELDKSQLHHELERAARSVLRDHAASPRAKASAHYYLGRALMFTAPRTAAQRARTARRELTRLGEHALAAEARDCEAGALSMMEDPSALYVAREALDEYRAAGGSEPSVEARMLSNIATYLLGRGRYAEAIATYHDALEVAGPLLDLGRLAQIYHGLAVAYVNTGLDRDALDYMDRAVQLSRTDHDLRGPAAARLARLENDYGYQLLRHGRFDRAEEMIRAALKHYAEAGVDAERSQSLLSLGELAQRRGLLDEAMHWTGEAIELAERRFEVLAQADGYQQLGELHADRAEYDRFEAYFERAIEVLERAGLPERRQECEARYQRRRSTVQRNEQPGV